MPKYDPRLAIKTSRGVVVLSASLVKQQHLSSESIKLILQEHVNKHALYDLILKEEDEGKLKRYARELSDLEYRLQDLWGFARSSLFHKFWKTPKCTCPHMDNDDRYPIGPYIFFNDCILHGGVK
jgi:hypothetical protein